MSITKVQPSVTRITEPASGIPICTMCPAPAGNVLSHSPGCARKHHEDARLRMRVPILEYCVRHAHAKHQSNTAVSARRGSASGEREEGCCLRDFRTAVGGERSSRARARRGRSLCREDGCRFGLALSAEAESRICKSVQDNPPQAKPIHVYKRVGSERHVAEAFAPYIERYKRCDWMT